jgi:hypothetical protein
VDISSFFISSFLTADLGDWILRFGSRRVGEGYEREQGFIGWLGIASGLRKFEWISDFILALLHGLNIPS